MKVMEIISPVLVMIVLGMLCRQWQLLNKNGIDNMKSLVTNIMLPVAIFHALATSDYGTETAKLVGIMFVMLVVSFCIGFLMKPLMTEHYRKYLPFMVSVYEGGSMAYPLYTSLCGAENLSQIAVLDIAGLLFGFSIYMGMLGQVENGEKINVKKLAVSAVKTPAFIASVLGIIAGLTGVVKFILVSPAGRIYTSVKHSDCSFDSNHSDRSRFQHGTDTGTFGTVCSDDRDAYCAAGSYDRGCSVGSA